LRVQGLGINPRLKTLNHAGENNEEATPVPIPNTEVKLFSAENTCPETDWEDRSSPAFLALLAQSAEHAAVNRSVVGSSPTQGAI
jgi:hypothetical protein